jgi:hypothetical protein
VPLSTMLGAALSHVERSEFASTFKVRRSLFGVRGSTVLTTAWVRRA